MAISIVLIVAEVPDSLRIGFTDLHSHPPFTIGMVLWIVWGYWLWRYYTAFHERPDKDFLTRHGTREHELIKCIAIKRFKRDPVLRKELDSRLSQIGTKKWQCVQVYGALKLTALRLGLVGYTENGTKDIDWRPEITVEGWPRTLAKYRAWVYVLFRTSLFSEYVVP